jgi:hypothetical protein
LLDGIDLLQRELGVVRFDGKLRCLEHFSVTGARLAESANKRWLLTMRDRNDGERKEGEEKGWLHEDWVASMGHHIYLFFLQTLLAPINLNGIATDDSTIKLLIDD